MTYKRSNQRFISLGADFNHPVDLLPVGKYPYLMNARAFQQGRLESRPGLTKVNSTVLPDANIHSIYRMNDYVAGAFLRFLGAGTNLYGGQDSFSLLSSGFSGDPLSIVPYLPIQSVNDFAYIANSQKMVKVDSAKNVYGIGIKPPNQIPSVELIPPLYAAPSGFDATSPFNVTSAWGNSGSSTTPVLNPSGIARLNGVSIGAIAYISGTTGWAVITPSGGNTSDIVAEMRVQIDSEYATVEEVHKAYSNSGLTIGAITYDVGNSGLCTIAPLFSTAGLARNSMVQLDSEWIRVISVTSGPNGVSSFRCYTSVTHNTSGVITLPDTGNIWIYLTQNHSPGASILCSLQEFEINPGSAGGTGSVYSNATTGGPFYGFGLVGDRPLSPDDYIHLGMWIDHPEYLTQCQVVLDVDTGTTNTHTTADGTKNAYTVTLRASNFQQYISNQQVSDTERASAIQLDLQKSTNVPLATPLAPPSALGTGQASLPVDVASTQDSQPPLPVLGSATSQLYTGASQWTEFMWKISDFLRIGSDQSVDLTVVKAILLNFTVGNTIFVKMAGMWSGGSYGPDSGNGLTPFLYRGRYRSSKIGSKSLPGPAVRSGITARRQGVLVALQASTDPQVDKIDVERLGGPNLTWNYVGTCDNSVANLLDDQFSAAVKINAPLDTDTFQPFTLSGAPLNLVGNISGTAVTLTSGAIDLNTSIGTEVIINGVLTTLYAQPTSPTLFHTADSLGFGIGIGISIPEPILAGQPLPVMWGPFQETLFGAGNKLDAGSLYFTKAQDPDSSPDTNRISMSSPSEMVMNGCVFNSKNYAFSDKGLYQIIQSSGPNPFAYAPIANAKGLLYRWGLCVGPSIWYVAKDGIYETGGEPPTCISDDLGLLFPQGDNPSQNVITGTGAVMYGVDTTQPVRLEYFNSYLIFNYYGLDGSKRRMFYDTELRAWYPDTLAVSSLVHCAEASLQNSGESVDLLMGSDNGFLYLCEGNSDDGVPIALEVHTPAFDGGDARTNKVQGDCVFSFDTQENQINVQAWLNYYTTSIGTPKSFITSDRVLTAPFDFPLDTFAQNVAFKIYGSSSVSQTYLYFWEPSWLDRPEDTALRATDWDNANYDGAKFLQGFLLEADTEGQNKTFNLEVDNEFIQTYTINFNGQEEQPFVVQPAFTGHLFRIVPTSVDGWRLFGIKWVWEPAPELVTYWETQTTSHDIPGYQFLKDGYIAHQSTADLTLKINVDGVDFIMTIPSSGGTYQKTYIIFSNNNTRMLKGRLFKYTLSSTKPFRLFQRDSEVRVHPWSSVRSLTGFGGYEVKQPFGDISRVGGARI